MSRGDIPLGRIDADHDGGYLYRLPYGDHVSFPIIQGYAAKLSHAGGAVSDARRHHQRATQRSALSELPRIANRLE